MNHKGISHLTMRHKLTSYLETNDEQIKSEENTNPLTTWRRSRYLDTSHVQTRSSAITRLITRLLLTTKAKIMGQEIMELVSCLLMSKCLKFYQPLFQLAIRVVASHLKTKTPGSCYNHLPIIAVVNRYLTTNRPATKFQAMRNEEAKLLTSSTQ